MNRALLPCVGALLTCAAPGASAQTSGVTIYGLIDVCVAYSDTGADSSKLVNSGCQNGSRLGFRGQEDLGNGLSAYFQLEQGLNMDNGTLGQSNATTTRIFGRKSLVGLSSKTLGSIEFGRDYSPAFYLLSPIDPLALGFGTLGSTMSTGANPTTIGRNDNSINYLTPNFGGWTGRLHYSLGEQAAPAASRGRDTMGANVIYKAGPWLGGLAYVSHRGATAADRDNAFTAGLSYDFGSFRLTSAFQAGEWEASRTAAAPSATSSFFSRDYRSYMLGGVAKVTQAVRVNFSLKHYDDRTAPDYDVTQATVLGSYAFSKRTDVYSGFSYLRNSTGGAYGIADGTTTYSGVTPGANTKLLAVGIRHLF